MAPERLFEWTVRASDGIERTAFLYVPAIEKSCRLVVTPHPFGFSALGNLFGEAAGPRTIVDVPGVAAAARRHGFAVLVLQSEGQRYTGMSVGAAGQLEAYQIALGDTAELVPELNTDRVGACGLSMGGQEALLLASSAIGDRVVAVAAQSPVTDLVAWYRALNRDGAAHAPALLAELGGDPRTNPDVWAARSPIEQVANLIDRGTAIQIRLNDRDEIVVATEQGRPYAAALRAAGGVVELIDDLPALDEADPGRSAHEYADWDAMLTWIGARL
jgi:pimeloyl-ACP methyl ester carboxylesterase